jgi:electron transport complex protein RnfE
VSSIKNFANGIFKENPVFGLLLGMCPTLAVTTVAINGLAMGVATTFVLLGSNIIVSIVKNHIPSNVRIPAFIIIIAAFVTIVEIIMQAYMIKMYNALGIFIPLIVVNCIILGRAEAFASKNNVLSSILDALGMGLGFTLSLTLISVIREALGNATVTFKIMGVGSIFKLDGLYKSLGLWSNNAPANLLIFILPAGGFLVLGLLLGGINKILETYKDIKIKRILNLDQERHK